MKYILLILILVGCSEQSPFNKNGFSVDGKYYNTKHCYIWENGDQISILLLDREFDLSKGGFVDGYGVTGVNISSVNVVSGHVGQYTYERLPNRTDIEISFFGVFVDGRTDDVGYIDPGLELVKRATLNIISREGNVYRLDYDAVLMDGIEIDGNFQGKLLPL